MGSYYLVWPKNRPPRAPLTSFLDWLAGQVAGT
jgi:DNA-binding transcriptional LysR family regulator